MIAPNGKSYIGKTDKSFEKRIYEHISSASNGDKKLLCKAIRKYGHQNFTNEILEECKSDISSEREIYWIDYYKSYFTENGYNMTRGGDGMDSETASHFRKQFWDSSKGEIRKIKLSEQFSKNNPCKKGNLPWNRGIPHTEETKEKMSQTHLERFKDPLVKERQAEIIRQNWINGAYDNRPIMSEETKKKIGQSQLGKKQTEYQKQRAREANLGKIVSDDTKKKIGAQNKGRILEEKICPHCGKNAPGGNYNRWHGDRCRNK